MNKTITIYELLGLVKDGKVPKHIKYKDYDLVWEESLCYYRTNRYGGWEMFYFNLSDLNDTVEIIEDDDKLEKIKSLNNVGSSINLTEFEDKQHLNNHILKDKINKIIDHINKIEEKLDER